MRLVKIEDEEGTTIFLNPEYIHGIVAMPEDGRSRIDYGSGYMDCVYVKKPQEMVARLFGYDPTLPWFIK